MKSISSSHGSRILQDWKYQNWRVAVVRSRHKSYSQIFAQEMLWMCSCCMGAIRTNMVLKILVIKDTLTTQSVSKWQQSCNLVISLRFPILLHSLWNFLSHNIQISFKYYSNHSQWLGFRLEAPFQYQMSWQLSNQCYQCILPELP